MSPKTRNTPAARSGAFARLRYTEKMSGRGASVSEFLQRLKERKLVQWAIAYVAAGFALLQGSDIIAQRFGWPESIERALIVALALGLFVTIVLAWYHGERGAQRVSGTELMILALLLVIGGGALWKLAGAPITAPGADAAATPAGAPPKASPASTAVVPHKSIAVLPFTDLSPAHDQEYFSDGMAEEILNALAKVKDLKVAGRTSSFSFKGKNDDLRVIGKALAVANVLEGSVRKQGEKVRITAQLIQAEDGYHLWSETYDGDLSDVFALQERIARAVTDQLKLVLEGEQQQRLVSTGTSNAEAYSLYLQATGIFNRREGARFAEAIGELDQALKLDPNYARAHSRLAAIHALVPIYAPEATESELAAVEREAALASQLDPTLAEPYAALGIANDQRDRHLDGRAAMEHALSLDPDDSTTNLWAAIEDISMGYTAKGCAQFDRVLAIDPMLPNALLWRAIQYMYVGNFDRAEVLLKRAADVGLTHVGVGLHVLSAARGQPAEATKQLLAGMRVLGAGFPADSLPLLANGVYGDAADKSKALAAIEEFLATKPKVLPGVVPYTLLLMHEDRLVLSLLALYGSSNGAWLYHLMWSPQERSLRMLPEFADFARKVGWITVWDKYGAPDACRRIALGDYDCGGESAAKP
jgi:TolB-like protein